MSAPDVPRLEPSEPETWGPCCCGEAGSYLERIKTPEWQNPKGEGRIGDYSGRGRNRFSRYIVMCDGCRELAIELDAHIALVESIRLRGEAAHDE